MNSAVLIAFVLIAFIVIDLIFSFTPYVVSRFMLPVAYGIR